VLPDADFVDMVQREGHGDQYVITAAGRGYLLGHVHRRVFNRANGWVRAMRKSAGWMSIWDDRILKYINENDGGSVGDMGENKLFRVSNSTVSRRSRKLCDHGVLRDLGNGVYVITSDGKSYLDGKLDAEELADESENGGEATA
jgi:hypothetical protein